MAYLTNTPQEQTILRLEARKSFSVTVRFVDINGKHCDLTSATVRLVVKKRPFDPDDINDDDNLISTPEAIIDDPPSGVCRFDVQASDLDLDVTGDYRFAIVLTTDQGYTGVVVAGPVTIVENPDFLSMADSFSETIDGTTSTLEVRMRRENNLSLTSGMAIPPGFTWLSLADQEKIDRLSVAGNLLPAGGLVNQMLAKATGDDYDFKWVNPQAFDGTLSAAGQPAQYAPVSNGDGSWDWAEVSSIVDWDTPEGQPGSILNKPALDFSPLGHTHDAADIDRGVMAEERLPTVIEHLGISWGYDFPTGGNDGDIYLRIVD